MQKHRVSDDWCHRIPRDCRAMDRKKRRNYNPDKMVDMKWCYQQRAAQEGLCWYCDVFMDVINRRSNKIGLTVERLDSAKPHERHNCVFACKSCNSKKKHRNADLLKELAAKWTQKKKDAKRRNRGARFV